MKTTLATNVAAALAATFFLASSASVSAQTTVETAQAQKPVSSKPAATEVVKTTPAAGSSRTELKSKAKNVAAGIEAAEAALTPDELAIAERVHVGKLPCELGASVTLTADAKAPGYFDVQGKNFKYHMFPVPTTTGTVRLEDRKAGAVWLQLGNKSMLMNQKLGTRLADECMSPVQVAVAENLKLNPPVSVLDAPKPDATTASAAPASRASAAK